MSASNVQAAEFRADPRKIIYTAADSGDEPLLMAGRLKGVPVYKICKQV